MDNLKSLMDRKEYELVVQLTKDTQDVTYLFYRISALLALGRGEEALKTIKNNRKILENDLLLLMKVHIEILCLLGKFDEAHEEVEYYKNLPYVSQQVEELLKELPKLVREEEKKAFASKELSNLELKKRLKSQDQNTVLPAIDMVRDRDINFFLEDIQEIMVSFPKQVIRSFALLLLVQKQVDKELDFMHVDKLIKVNPSKLEPPFIGEEFNSFVRTMQNEIRNPSINQDAVQILSSYIIYMYPEKLSIPYPVLIEALRKISEEYLRIEGESSLEQRCQEKGIKLEEVEELIRRIKDVMEDF